MRLFACAALLMSGCYLSHSRADRDAAVMRDAGPPDTGVIARDAGPDSGVPSGAYWTLEERRAFVRVPDFPCTTFVGGHAIVTVAVPIMSLCEHGGPVRLDRAGGGTYFVTAHVWVDHRAPVGEGECAWIAAIAQRDVAIPLDVESLELIETSSGESVRITARDEPHACSMMGARQSDCRLDCDCAPGLVCLANIGDDAECFGGRCGELCNRGEETFVVDRVSDPDMDCAPDHECPDDAVLGSDACVPRAAGNCGLGRECMPGRECRVEDPITVCHWPIPALGAACASDVGCPPGTHCVELRTGEGRACAVPCFTHAMRCPEGLACDPDEWICR